MERFDNTVKKYTNWLNNEYVSSVLIAFLIVYASLVAPKLPKWLAELFDYALFKFVIFFLIVYTSKHNATVALLASVGLMVSLLALQHIKFKNELMTVVNNENFSTDLPVVMESEMRNGEESNQMLVDHVLDANQETLVKTVDSSNSPMHAPPTTQSELANEVLRRKNAEESRRGAELSDAELKQLCHSVLADKYNFGADVSNNELSSIDYAPLNEQ